MSAVESHYTGALFSGEWNSVLLSHNIFLLFIKYLSLLLLLFCVKDVNLSLSSAVLLADVYGNFKNFNSAKDLKKKKGGKLHMKGLNDRTKSGI